MRSAAEWEDKKRLRLLFNWRELLGGKENGGGKHKVER
jgi:hypothetical protein